MSIIWNEAMYRKWYRLPNQQGQMTTYSRVGWRYFRGPDREWGYPVTPGWKPELGRDPLQHPDHPLNEYRHRVERVRAQFPIADDSRVLVLGCGSGFLPETFIWNGIQVGRVCGADPSSYIQANIVEEAHALMQGKVINRSMQLGATNPQMRGSLRAAAPDVANFGTTAEFFDFVITESVLESYTAAERTPAFYDTLQSYLKAGLPASNVIHIVCDGWDAASDGGSPAMTLEEWAATRPQNSWVSYNGDMPAIAGTG